MQLESCQCRSKTNYKTASIGVFANVLDKISLEEAKKKLIPNSDPIDILVNGAGGNSPRATTKVEKMAGY